MQCIVSGSDNSDILRCTITILTVILVRTAFVIPGKAPTWVAFPAKKHEEKNKNQQLLSRS